MRLLRIVLLTLIALSTVLLAKGQQQDAPPADSSQQEAQPSDDPAQQPTSQSNNPRQDDQPQAAPQGKPSPAIPLPEDQSRDESQPSPGPRTPRHRQPMEREPVERQAMEPPYTWLPPDVEALRNGASSKIEFSLDHSMLVLASKFDADDDDLQRVIAGVSGVSVHSFHFPAPGMYDPRILGAVRADYHAAGWKQVMNKYDKNGGPGVTGLWVRLENNAISDIAILVARPNDVNLIEVAGSISPLDLLHLCGHFGIPRIQGGVVVSRNAR